MSTKDEYPPSSTDEVAISWSALQTTSDAAKILGLRLIGIALPAVFAGTSVSFLVKVGSSYLPMYVGNVLYALTVGTSRFIPVKIPYFAATAEIKIVSNAAEAIATEIQLVVRPV